MPVAKSFEELEQMIMKDVQSAMEETRAKSEEIMKEQVSNYHDGCRHKLYIPTGNLASSPRTTGVTGGGNKRSFEFYLDQSLSYSGINSYLQSLGYKSYFSTLQAYTAAENGTSHTTGRHGFWQRSEQLTELALKINFMNYFYLG